MIADSVLEVCKQRPTNELITPMNLIQFGVCDDNASFFNSKQILPSEINWTGVDVNKNETFDSLIEDNNITLFNDSMQEWIDNGHGNKLYDVALITGIFDKPKYGDRQYDFITKTIEMCRKFSKCGIVFTLNPNNFHPEFDYNIVYLYVLMITEFETVIVKKLNDDYIFSIIF